MMTPQTQPPPPQSIKANTATDQQDVRLCEMTTFYLLYFYTH